MGLIRTVEPDEEPISLDEAKAQIRQDLDVDDDLIVGWIRDAREFCESSTERSLVTQTWQLTLDYCWPEVRRSGRCVNRIVIPRPPLASVTSVQYVDSAGATQTLAADQYQVYRRDTGESAIEPAYGVTWPTVREQPAAITVTFVAGTAAASVPELAKSLMKLYIAHRDQNREAVNVGNIVTEMPLGVDVLIDRLRVYPR
jgi:uncharacterized phiE125 gp8 family phage protein